MFTMRLLTLAFLAAPLSAHAQNCVFTQTLIVHPDGARQMVITDERCEHRVQTGIGRPDGNFDWHDAGRYGGANRTHSDVVKEYKGNGIATNVTPPREAVRGGSGQEGPRMGTGPREGPVPGGGKLEPMPGRTGDFGNQPGTGAGASGGSGPRICKIDIGPCRGQIVTWAPDAYSSFKDWWFIFGGLVGLGGLALIFRNRIQSIDGVNPDSLARTHRASRLGQIVALIGMLVLLLGGVLL